MEKEQTDWEKLYQRVVKNTPPEGLPGEIRETTQIEKFSLLRDYRVEYSYKAGIEK